MDTSELRFIPFRERDNRYVPLLVFLSIVLVSLWFTFGVAFRAEKVDGDSMRDTLMTGDRMLVTRGYATPARGDIVSADVVIQGQPDRILKRVVGLPGDTIEVRGDSVWVNGLLASWPGVITGSADRFHLGPFEVPPRHLYVLGDNRPVSLDSRYIGPIPLDQVRGKAVAVYLPVTRIGRID